MRSLLLIIGALGISLLMTSASYLIDTGCSCGPARGLPFRYIHPLIGCTTGRFVVGADPQNRFGPVFDIESVAYDLLLWGAVGFFVLWKVSSRRSSVHENAAA